MRRDDAKKLIAALIRRRHNDALKIKRLRSRLNDAPAKCFIAKISSSEIPEAFKGLEFSPSKIQIVLKKLKNALIKSGENGNGRVEIHTIDKFGHSRDFYNL